LARLFENKSRTETTSGMSSQFELVGSHLAKLYEDGLFTDTTFIVGDQIFHVHRVVLSMSGFFSALLSESWNETQSLSSQQRGGGGGGGDRDVSGFPSTSSSPPNQNDRPGYIEPLEFTIECEQQQWRLFKKGNGEGGRYDHSKGGITPESFSEMIRFLYGLTPIITHENAHSLLSTASFFDVPGLMQVISDFIFGGLTDENCSLHLAFVHNKEFGDAGKLIEDASFAYLFRNAVDIGEARLVSLPLVHQKRLLLASELFVPSEYVRYQLAIGLLRQSRSRIVYEERQVLASREGSLAVLTVLPLSGSLSNSRSPQESLSDDTDDGLGSVLTASSHIPSPPSNTRASATSEGSWEGDHRTGRKLRIDTRSGAASSILSGAGGGSSSVNSSRSKMSGGGSLTASASTHRQQIVQRPICELSSISDISGHTRRVSTLSPTGAHAHHANNNEEEDGQGRNTSSTISRNSAPGFLSSRGNSTTENQRSINSPLPLPLLASSSNLRAIGSSAIGRILRAAATSLLKSVGADDAYAGAILGPESIPSHHVTTKSDAGFTVNSPPSHGPCDSPSLATSSSIWGAQLEQTDGLMKEMLPSTNEKVMTVLVGAEAAMRSADNIESKVISKNLLEDMSSSISIQRNERNFRAEMTELRLAYTEILESLRLSHMTESELKQVLSDGEISHATVTLAIEASKRIRAKLTAASNFNVRRVSELDAISPTSLGASVDVRDTRWLPYRFGIEMNGIFGEDMSPLSDGEPRTRSSERVSYAGSHWCLDVKRYQNHEEGQEFVAVYLRRRPLLLPNMAGGVAVQGPEAPEDTRERTTMGFSIRLCGAPGAPTSNSVCGRSVMGKAFGLDQEQSWGWESFVSLLSLTERPWFSGDKLRFVVSLEML